MFLSGRIRITLSLCLLLALGLVCLALAGCSNSTASVREREPDQIQLRKLKALNETADTMYKLAKEGKFPEARDQLEMFTNQMTKLSYSGITSAEGLNALTGLVAEAREIYNRVKIVPEQNMLAAAKLRFAADALSHKDDPLWLGYRKLFKEDAKLVAAALKERNDVKSLESLHTFYKHYLIIRPAILISRDAALVEKLDSWFVFMNGLLTQVNIDYAKAAAGIAHTDDLIAELFRGGEAATSAQPFSERPPILWISVLSGAIVSVLFYVGWKKYRFMGG